MKHIETDKDEEEEEEENDEKPAVSAMSWSTDGGGGWGASTYFLDPPTGEMVEVQPAPGRVVIMDQDVTHTVSAPSREAGGRPRYSLVWKLAVFPPAPPPPPLQTPPLPSGEEKGSASFAGADAAGSGFLPSAADIVRGGVGRDRVWGESRTVVGVGGGPNPHIPGAISRFRTHFFYIRGTKILFFK